MTEQQILAAIAVETDRLVDELDACLRAGNIELALTKHECLVSLDNLNEYVLERDFDK